MTRPVIRALAAFLVFAALLFAGRRAEAYTPPPIRGHVMDQAGVLTPAQVLALDRKLDQARKQTGFAIVVLTLSALPPDTNIEDVAYDTFNAWGVGSAKGDDGVLVVNAVAERKLRIETGKGVGGGLTDLGSSHINRDVMGPLLKESRYYEAYDQGTAAILRELTTGTPGGTSEAGKGPANRAPPAGALPSGVKTIAIGIGLVLVIILAIISPTFREILFWVLLFGRGGGGGGGFGGGGGGGSGYGGGGGRSGGGGSSDDY